MSIVSIHTSHATKSESKKLQGIAKSYKVTTVITDKTAELEMSATDASNFYSDCRRAGLAWLVA